MAKIYMTVEIDAENKIELSEFVAPYLKFDEYVEDMKLSVEKLAFKMTNILEAIYPEEK
jgi:hypothetical protein